MSAWLAQESRIEDTADTARHETKSYGLKFTYSCVFTRSVQILHHSIEKKKL